METINYIDTLLNKQSNYDESTDAIVPDMYPDISKIIGVTANTYIKDSAVQNDRILISGDVLCDLCYVPEGEGAPIIMKVPLSFAHIEQALAEEIKVSCTIELNKVEARVINPRKISILASICIHTKAYNEKIISMSDIVNDGYEILYHEESVNLIDSVNIDEFSISDNIEFKEIITNDYELYGIKPRIIINDTKILKNKLMLRGDVEFVSTLLDEYDMMKISQSIPFSQILDINIRDENLDANVEICIKSFDIENISGAEFSFNLNVKTCITQTKNEVFPVLSDIYDVKNELTINSSKYSVTNTPKCELEKCDFNIFVDCENIVDSVLHSECQLFVEHDEKNMLECFARVSGIYKSGREYHNFEYKHKFMQELALSDVGFKNIKISNVGTNAINLNITADMYKYRDVKVDIDVVETIVRGNAHEKVSNTIILKYISNETKLWEIAKKYNTTMMDIINSNSLEADIKVVSNVMLLIPVK